MGRSTRYRSPNVLSRSSAVDLPVIADFDTGYGNALNALHTLKGFERGCCGFTSKTRFSPKVSSRRQDRRAGGRTGNQDRPSRKIRPTRIRRYRATGLLIEGAGASSVQTAGGGRDMFIRHANGRQVEKLSMGYRARLKCAGGKTLSSGKLEPGD